MTETWDIQKVLTWTTQHFESKSIPSARLDAELLLAHILKCKRIELYLKFDQPVETQNLSRYKELIKRRTQLEPVAYILGEKDFYGRTFNVGQGVLVPRPETEHLVEEVLLNKKDEEFSILDVATGSGCIAATLAAEIPNAKIKALDVSKDSEKFSKENFLKLNVADRVEFILSDFVEYANSTQEKFDFVISNPPYISLRAELMTDVKMYEPSLALYGGEVGDEILKKWLPLMYNICKPGGTILCEIGFDQKNAVEEIFKEQTVTFVKDYSGKDRVMKVVKNG